MHSTFMGGELPLYSFGGLRYVTTIFHLQFNVSLEARGPSDIRLAQEELLLRYLRAARASQRRGLDRLQASTIQVDQGETILSCP